MSSLRSPKSSPKIAILAGQGALPRLVAEQCDREGRSGVIISLGGAADEAWLKVYRGTTNWHVESLALGQVGKLLRVIQTHNVTELVMIGGMGRISLAPENGLSPSSVVALWQKIGLDFVGFQWLLRYWTRSRQSGRAQGGDDHLLRFLIDQFETKGLRVLGAHHILPDMTQVVGCLTHAAPSKIQQQDISLGMQVVGAMGAYDIGQAVAVQQGLVLAVEAMEGTAKMIARAGEVKHATKKTAAKPILVKRAKPAQDLRVDMPTIGPETIDQVIAAGFAGIAIEAERVQVIDAIDVIETCNNSGIFLTVEATA